MTTILYKRVSTDKQDMARQNSSLAGYCGRHKLSVEHVLSDPDESGGKPIAERPEGQKLAGIMASYKSSHKPFAVVVTEQDRLGRDVIDQIQTIRQIWDAGGIVHFTLEGGEMRRDQHEVLINIKAAMAQEVLSQIRKKTQSKMRELVETNQLAGHIPFGFDAVYSFFDGHQERVATVALNFGDSRQKKPAEARVIELISAHGDVTKKSLVDNDGEQYWIRWMADRQREGWSFKRIALALRTRLVKTKQGKEFQFNNVASVLRNGYTARLLAAPAPTLEAA